MKTKKQITMSQLRSLFMISKQKIVREFMSHKSSEAVLITFGLVKLNSKKELEVTSEGKKVLKFYMYGYDLYPIAYNDYNLKKVS